MRAKSYSVVSTPVLPDDRHDNQTATAHAGYAYAKVFRRYGSNARSKRLFRQGRANP